MKITDLKILNFRGIREVSLESLGNMVIIAGQNGSGKSCIFDAIRLLKSVYGGYQINEWHQWMGEFQIGLTNLSSDYRAMFNDVTKPMSIECSFCLHDDERKYLQNNSENLLRDRIWRGIKPEVHNWGNDDFVSFTPQLREQAKEVEKTAASQHESFLSELTSPLLKAALTIRPGETFGDDVVKESLALEIIFGTFRPNDLGIIDFHGAQRSYGREQVQNINLNLETSKQQRSQHTLYNYAGKYANIKSEMATSHIRDLVARDGGNQLSQQATLEKTLQELFRTFFPDKKFLGAKATADGTLKFQVQTQSGSEHDLNELSAGEKEILYGYLRIRNSAPKNSIVLLDEPELHLNPRLVRDLPRFYKKHLGEELGNQMWLVTHSDALLRQAVCDNGYNVFHMSPEASLPFGQAQLKRLSANIDLDLAIVDLVGDLAAYKPSGKIVILEGGGDSDFDMRVVSLLYPKMQEQANLVSGTNKRKVTALQKILHTAHQKGHLPFKCYSITDPDLSKVTSDTTNRTFSWDVYHIENYLLSPKYICQALTSLYMGQILDEAEILEELRLAANQLLPNLVHHELRSEVNKQLMEAINVNINPYSQNLSSDFSGSVLKSIDNLKKLSQNTLAEADLRVLESAIHARFSLRLSNGTWITEFNGREILAKFAHKHAKSIPYEQFRNLVLAEMKNHEFQPSGMSDVINAILAD